MKKILVFVLFMMIFIFPLQLAATDWYFEARLLYFQLKDVMGKIAEGSADPALLEQRNNLIERFREASKNSGQASDNIESILKKLQEQMNLNARITTELERDADLLQQFADKYVVKYFSKKPSGVTDAAWLQYLKRAAKAAQGDYNTLEADDLQEALRIENLLPPSTKDEMAKELKIMSRAHSKKIGYVITETTQKGGILSKLKGFGKWLGFGGRALSIYGTYSTMKEFTDNAFDPQETRGSSIIIPPRMKQVDPRPILDTIGIPSRYRIDNKDRLQYLNPQTRNWIGIGRPLTPAEKQERERLINAKIAEES